MAEFSRRAGIGRSVLKRIMETQGYCYGVTFAQTDRLATVFNVTREYLERGTARIAQTPNTLATQFEMSRLRAEVDRLRRRRGLEPMLDTSNRADITTLLTRASDAHLELIYRDGKYVVVREHEFEIAEADMMKRALEIALDDSHNR